MTDAPRLKHNRDLAAAYIASSGILSRYPKISDQIECLPLQTEKLVPNGYNPTIMDADGSLCMCYRYHEGSPATKLACARFNEKGEVESWWYLPIDVPGSVEDPKFFMREAVAHLSFVQSNYPTGMKAIVKFGVFAVTRAEQIVQPKIGQNDFSACEKNWLFWEQLGTLFCLYRCSPTHKIFQIEADRGIPLTETPAPRWPYGEIRGGTPPVQYEGKLLRFFHSRLKNELNPPHFRYYVGAYLMEPSPPFAVVRVSRKPILYGSEIDDLKVEQRKACVHWKANVVFPGGAVARDGYWLLSVGVNDSACVIAKVKPETLNL